MNNQLFQKPVLSANNFLKNYEVIDAIQWYTFACARYKEIRSLIECSLRRSCNFLNSKWILPINPLFDLQATDTAHQWISEGQDPFFLISDISHFNQHQGWFEVHLVITSPVKHNKCRLYLDYGEDFSDENTVNIPYQSDCLASKVFKVERSIVRLRFDPLETSGKFFIKAFVVNPISEDMAQQHMIWRLMQDEKFINHSLDDTLAHIKEIKINKKISQVDALEQCYESLFLANNNPSYLEWISNVEIPSLPSETEMQLDIASMKLKPLISIVMPVYNTQAAYLKACIDSVLAQSYYRWELCIADDNSPQPHIKNILNHYQKLDRRIKVIYRKENGHISRASNSALELASGDYVALLDHDDLLPAQALYFVARSINQNPTAQIIYSDEDKIDEKGVRFEPHFKSDWNPDLFYSQNYVSHLGIYRHDILKKIKGFRTGVEGSQDQDLLLRCLRHTKPENILHIPKVLYHWRALEGSTALNSGEKSYTTEAGIKALCDHFNDIGSTGVEVSEGQVPNTYRVKWPVPSPEPLVTLLIPTRDRKEITELAVNSILNKTTYPNYEIIIIDNGSVEPETLAWFKEVQKDERVSVLPYDKPFNYSAINNFGARYAKGSVLGLINNDVEVISPDWLTEMISHAIRPDIGCVGAKLYYENDTIQHAGVILGIGGVANHSHKNFGRNSPGYFARLFALQNYSAVTAACLLVRKNIFDQVDGLDEKNLTVAFNDVDFCLKVKQLGYRNLWTPYAELYHHESVSRGAEDNPDKLKRFHGEVEFMQKKWTNELRLDPFYNPNLTRIKEDFSLLIE